MNDRDLKILISMSNTLMKELKIANSYIWESIKAVDFIIKLLGKVIDERRKESGGESSSS